MKTDSNIGKREMGNMGSRVSVIGHENVDVMDNAYNGDTEKAPYDNSLGYRNTYVYKALRPFLLCMKLFGMYHEVPEGQTLSSGMMYCAFITLLLLFNAVRYLWAFSAGEAFEEALFIKVVYAVWFFQSACNAMVLLFASCRPRHFNAYFRHWQTLPRESCGMPSYDTAFRIEIYILLILSLAFTLANTAGLAYFIFSPDPAVKSRAFLLAAPFGTKGNVHDWVKAFCIVLHFLCSAAWILPIAMYTLLCQAVTLEFKTFNSSFASAIQPNGSFSGDFPQFRRRHHQISGFVDYIDQSFRVFTANAYLTNIPLALIILYVLLWPEHRVAFFIFLYCFWLVTNLFHMAMVTWSAAGVQKQAHAAFSDLHNINPAKLGADQAMEVTLFLHKLGGPPMGVSVLDLFTIDNSIFLTIGSILVTYFIILVQFKMPML